MSRPWLSPVLIMLLALLVAGGAQSVRSDDATDCQRGQGKKQIQACSRIIESGRLSGQPIGKKNRAAAHLNRGSAFTKTGAFGRAIADYNKAIELNPDYAQAYYNRGIAYGKKGEVDRAIADYNKAIELDPEYAAAYNNRGIAYQYKGDIDRAIADYNKAIELKSDYATAYNNRGDAYEKKGDMARAKADYRKALALDPSHKAAKYNLEKLGAAP